LTLHQRREAIRRRDYDGEPVREIARSYNVSHSTISRLTALAKPLAAQHYDNLDSAGCAAMQLSSAEER
jgi:Mor family transcriptional regulator